jgi:hypothetical protein
VKQHFDDYIIDNMTFKDLYDRRIITTLAPLQTYVFEKWHYKRLVTIGDSAHKVSRITFAFGHENYCARKATSVRANKSVSHRSIPSRARAEMAPLSLGHF